MAKPELGMKRLCPGCGVKYYDLNRNPITCPKCGTIFELAETSVRPEKASAVVKDEEDDIEDEADGAEVVSLEDVEEDNDDDGVPGIEDEEDIDTDLDDEDDTTFLEDEEDEDDDVGGIRVDVDASDDDR